MELRSARIFLAEDNQADVFLVREALVAHGVIFELELAEDGETACRSLARLCADAGELLPDLVVLDLNLPKRNGREVLRQVRASERCRDLPVVVLTSSDSPTDREQAQALGANAYYQKPARLDDFLKLGAALKSFLPSLAS